MARAEQYRATRPKHLVTPIAPRKRDETVPRDDPELKARKDYLQRMKKRKAKKGSPQRGAHGVALRAPSSSNRRRCPVCGKGHIYRDLDARVETIEYRGRRATFKIGMDVCDSCDENFPTELDQMEADRLEQEFVEAVDRILGPLPPVEEKKGASDDVPPA